jgi:hypothetical protein
MQVISQISQASLKKPNFNSVEAFYKTANQENNLIKKTIQGKGKSK